MFDKLDFIVEKYEEMSLKVSDPEIINNQPLWQKYIKDMGEMEPIVKKYAEYKKAKEELADALADEGVYWDMAYVVRGVLGYGGRNTKHTYLVTDVWDESHGEGEVRAYRWNVQGEGSFEYNAAQKAYRKVKAQG